MTLIERLFALHRLHPGKPIVVPRPVWIAAFLDDLQAAVDRYNRNQKIIDDLKRRNRCA